MTRILHALENTEETAAATLDSFMSCGQVPTRSFLSRTDKRRLPLGGTRRFFGVLLT